MSAFRWQLRCILAGLLLAGCVHATTTSRNSTDYDGILKRNPFQLRPPQAEPPPPPPPAAPPSNIELNGLMTAFGQRQVFMTVKNQKGETAYKSLSVGDPADDGIEVLSLDIATGEVRVRNRGTEALLTMKQNAAKVPVGAAPAPLPVPTPFRAPVPGVPQPAAGGMPSGIGEDGMPTGIGNAPAAPAGTPTVIPTRSIRVPATPASPTTTQTLSPAVEAQIIQMEINKLINQGGPPLPPTPLTPAQ